jgi:hypothetical protein
MPGRAVVRAARERDQASNYLQSRETATTVRLGSGEPLVIDGPFLEGNELIGGYAEIDVADLDAALAMAKGVAWRGRR